MALETDQASEIEERRSPRQRAPQSGADVVYALGIVGALVWFWRRADGVGGHALAVLKALVWPALLVHAAFDALRG